MKVHKAKSFCLSTIALDYSVRNDIWLCANCKTVFGQLPQDLSAETFELYRQHFRDVTPGQYLEMLIFIAQIRLMLD